MDFHEFSHVSRVPPPTRWNWELKTFTGRISRTQFLKSEKLYLKIIKKNTNDSIALLNLGVIAEKLNKLEKAISYFEKAIKSGPENYTAYYNIANVYKKQKNYEKAISNYNKAIELNPNVSICLNLKSLRFLKNCQR